MFVEAEKIILKKKEEWLSHRFLNQFEIQSMIWPALICLVIFSYIPMYGIIIAFKDFNIITGIKGTEWVGLKYLTEFFLDPNLWGVVRNTLCINLFGLIFSFPAPIILALSINELKSGMFKKTAQTLSYLPHFLSWVIFGGIFMEILSNTGLVNAVLLALGLISKPYNFMAHGENFYLIITVISIIKSVGYNSILFVAAIAGVDQELYEAAVIDGCNRLQKMWYITLPSILGTVTIILIFQISNILNTGFEQILIFQNPLNIGFTETLDTYVYKIGMVQSRFSYATAVGLLKSIIAIILLLIANKTSKELTDRGLF